MFGWPKWKNETRALPAEVATIIEGMALFRRPDGQDGIPRVVVQLEGFSGWLYGDHDAERLAKLFPDLSPAQVARASRYLATMVRQRLADLENGGRPERQNWVNRW